MRTKIVKPKPKAGSDSLTAEERFERDAARYETLAREHGADLSENGFNDALRKVGRRAPETGTPPTRKD